MRHVALTGSGFLEVNGPLLQLAVRANRVGDESITFLNQALSPLAVYIQNSRSIGAVFEELADERYIHSAASADVRFLSIGSSEIVFGGDGGAGGESAFSI